MKIDAAALAIVNAWNTAWTALYGDPPSIPYVLDDEQFSEPNPSSSWVRFAIRHQISNQISLGSPMRFERRGILFVQLFTPIDQGRNALDVLVRQTIDAMEKQTIGSISDCITTIAATAREVPTTGEWAQASVTVPFYYWETK
jgi:hypothetical protein